MERLTYSLYLIDLVKKARRSFNPFKNEIYSDEETLENPYRLRKTIFHELIHKAQEVLGRLRLPKYIVEREATYLTYFLM